MQEFKEIHELLYNCVVGLSQFSAGTVALRELVNG
jgi:hypothetical protein